MFETRDVTKKRKRGTDEFAIQKRALIPSSKLLSDEEEEGEILEDGEIDTAETTREMPEPALLHPELPNSAMDLDGDEIQVLLAPPRPADNSFPIRNLSGSSVHPFLPPRPGAATHSHILPLSPPRTAHLPQRPAVSSKTPLNSASLPFNRKLSAKQRFYRNLLLLQPSFASKRNLKL